MMELIIIPLLVNILTFIIIKSHISTISHKNDKINHNLKILIKMGGLI